MTHEQLTPEEQEAKWRQDRLGCATGSRIYHIVGRNKDKTYKAARRHYGREKLLERLTGQPHNNCFSTPAMQWGNDHEREAIEEYEKKSAHFVYPLGKVFISHPRIRYSGCSPDALVGNVGGLEVKCPETDTHLSFLDTGAVPEEYKPQVLWNLACHPDRQWWDFMSFDPRCPKHMQMRVTRIERLGHTLEINALEKEVELFLDEVAFQVMKWEQWRL